MLLAVSGQSAQALAAAGTNSNSSGSATPASFPNGSGSSAPTQSVVTETVAAQTVTAPSSSTGGSKSGSSGNSSGSSSVLPPVKHVFVVMLSGQGYNQSFGPQSDLPYLDKTLRPQGELVPYYYGVAQSSLANAIALISGQGPTVQTAADCPQYTDITPAKTGSEGQVLGNGCVYPTSTQTLPGELTAAGQTWKAYVHGVDDGPAGSAQTCRHPTIDAADTIRRHSPAIRI